MAALIDTWIHLGSYLQLKDVTDTDAMSYYFHHIRPRSDFTVALTDATVLRIRQYEPSVIIGKTNPNTRNFHCAKAKTGGILNPMKLYSANDALKMESNFTFWNLPFDALLKSGIWEVWNGPTPIVLWNDTVDGRKVRGTL